MLWDQSGAQGGSAPFQMALEELHSVKVMVVSPLNGELEA